MQDELLKLKPRHFEDLIHDILEADGFKVTYHAGVGADKGRDLVAQKIINNSLEPIEKRYLVQCKRYKKNVSERDVLNIYEKIKQFGVNGYLLAVTSDITTGLNDMIDEINSNNPEYVGVWRPRDIINKLYQYDFVMRKYFPQEYDKYVGLIKTGNIINLFERIFNRKPTKQEIDEYTNFIRKIGIREEIIKLAACRRTLS